MVRKIKMLLGVAACALVATMLSVTAGAIVRQDRGGPPPFGPGHGPEHMLARLAHDLNLTDDQVARIQAIMEDEHARVEPYLTRMRELRDEMEAAVAKLRETIEAIRAFWDCWQNGTPLRYTGEFFKLRLMTPFFSPGPIDYPPPPIYIAAVNEQMLRLAGSHCDGVHIHALHTVRYMREVAMPAIEFGLAHSGRQRADFVHADVLIEADAAFRRAEDGAVVDAVAGEHLDTPVVAAHREVHGELAARVAHKFDDIVVDVVEVLRSSVVLG